VAPKRVRRNARFRPVDRAQPRRSPRRWASQLIASLRERAPRLRAALAYYGWLRRQSRELAAASRDSRPVEQLVTANDDGIVTGIEGHSLVDPRLQVGFMTPVQMRGELLGMLERVRELRPRRLCEIGASAGGTLYLLTRVAEPDAVIVSLDIDIPPPTRRARARMARDSQRVISIQADSHDPLTRDRVAEKLGGEQLDFLFIDGDHSYDGVRTDFELYRDLVRDGGLIALHDINPDQRSTRPEPEGPISGDVPRFWREVAAEHRSEELIDRPGQDGFGIGLLYV
jgi:predicted O-methyltransferase YrrM